ncbi:MAG: hypothetical protein AMJ45_01455 [Syntrophobacter sp. DG_60]|nr:MAG: hypothetical protein AMJ45_01455 [Syntrophobacter sp. DG_60]
MPAGNGTGPFGLGPMTGRGMGYCAGYGLPGYAAPRPRLGLGRGRGRGFRWQYWATGLPGWRRYGYTPGVAGGYPVAAPVSPGVAPEQELGFLKNQASFLEQQLNAILNRIKELEPTKG